MCIQIPPIEKDIHLWHGKSEELLQHVEDNSIDSIVTDPPYGISFMGKDWDSALPPKEVWQECIRVLKPGGYIVAMSASRMYHRLAVQLEDLGLICHPMIGWIYGSGFPKATDLSKQFDKQACAEREIIGKSSRHVSGKPNQRTSGLCGSKTFQETIGMGQHVTAPSTEIAKKWDGYKYGLQALKPALEPIAVFQKPWKSKDVKRMTDNVKKYGVGAFNIDACRVPTSEKSKRDHKGKVYDNVADGYKRPNASSFQHKTNWEMQTQGRHPANLLHDGSEPVEQALLDQGGIRTSGAAKDTYVQKEPENIAMSGKNYERKMENRDSTTGSVSRYFNKLQTTELDTPFFYCSKPSKKEKNQGLNEPEINKHETVKPIALMEWLVKLVTPEGGTTVDPFLGSGTTGIAAVKNNFKFIGIEKGLESYNIAQKRIEHAARQ